MEFFLRRLWAVCLTGALLVPYADASAFRLPLSLRKALPCPALSSEALAARAGFARPFGLGAKIAVGALGLGTGALAVYTQGEGLGRIFTSLPVMKSAFGAAVPASWPEFCVFLWLATTLAAMAAAWKRTKKSPENPHSPEAQRLAERFSEFHDLWGNDRFLFQLKHSPAVEEETRYQSTASGNALPVWETAPSGQLSGVRIVKDSPTEQLIHLSEGWAYRTTLPYNETAIALGTGHPRQQEGAIVAAFGDDKNNKKVIVLWRARVDPGATPARHGHLVKTLFGEWLKDLHTVRAFVLYTPKSTELPDGETLRTAWGSDSVTVIPYQGAATAVATAGGFAAYVFKSKGSQRRGKLSADALLRDGAFRAWDWPPPAQTILADLLTLARILLGDASSVEKALSKTGIVPHARYENAAKKMRQAGIPVPLFAEFEEWSKKVFGPHGLEMTTLLKDYVNYAFEKMVKNYQEMLPGMRRSAFAVDVFERILSVLTPIQISVLLARVDQDEPRREMIADLSAAPVRQPNWLDILITLFRSYPDLNRNARTYNSGRSLYLRKEEAIRRRMEDWKARAA